MSTTPARRFDTDLPDAKGYFGPYGGQLVPPVLKQVMDDIDAAYETIRQRADFQEELASLLADYVGRPSPIFHARRLSKQLGGAQIHLKREDLNHTIRVRTRSTTAWARHCWPASWARRR
mgnify:CR=1 FL=1